MYKYFEDIPLDNEENISEEHLQKIKASVLSRVKEDRSMKKCTTIKTLSIAAVAAATAMLSAMIASADLPQAPTTDWEPVENVSEAQDNKADNDNKAPETDVKKEDTISGWSEIVDPETDDYISIYDEEKDVYYYIRLENPKDKINSEVVPWDAIYEEGDVCAIYNNEVLVDPQELTYEDGKLVYTPKS